MALVPKRKAMRAKADPLPRGSVGRFMMGKALRTKLQFKANAPPTRKPKLLPKPLAKTPLIAVPKHKFKSEPMPKSKPMPVAGKGAHYLIAMPVAIPGLKSKAPPLPVPRNSDGCLPGSTGMRLAASAAAATRNTAATAAAAGTAATTAANATNATAVTH